MASPNSLCEMGLASLPLTASFPHYCHVKLTTVIHGHTYTIQMAFLIDYICIQMAPDYVYCVSVEKRLLF